MKFLCDNCKAKYQIADEKVAGKTVRMKCRKCGHQIEVRAAVTETSVASVPPQAPQAPRPSAPRGLATSLSATKPRAPSHAPMSGALAGAFQRNVQDAPNTMPFPHAGPGSGGSRGIELSVTDEWYVAINGVPVGPVRISELRRKAAAGAVTEESLCWQEGLEEWRPIRSIPELAQLVREAAQGNRPSLAGPPPPPPLPAAARPPVPQRSDMGRGIGSFSDRSHGSTPPPPAPQRFSEPPRPAAMLDRAQRSNVVPLHARISSPSFPDRTDRSDRPDRLEDAPHTAPFGGAAHALAPTFTPAPSPAVTHPVHSPLAPMTDPFAITPAPHPLMPPSTASFMPPPPTAYVEQQKKGVPLWFWPILLLALGFGGGVAFLVFRPQPQQPVVIQVPAPTQAATDKHDVPPPTSDPAPPPTTDTTKPPGKIAAVPRGQPQPATGPKIDLGGLGSPAGGPAVGPNGNTTTTTTAAGGGTFDQAAVERVVANHRAGVKRSCWERVSGPDQKSSVNVMVNATVAPNGTVSSTSSSGDDPVVAKCIEGQVKGWTFPPPGETKQIALPFKFVRQ